MPRPAPTTRRALAVLATVLTSATTLPAATARADESHVPVSGTFTLIGRGYGHGRGMSQWGSYQQAVEGRTWQQVLGFYYPGLTISSTTAASIRVGTQGHTGNTVRVAAETGLTATDGAGQSIALPTSDAGAPITAWEVARPASGGTATTTTLWYRTATARKALRSTESGRWTISASDGSLRAENASGAIVATYLGRFTGVRNGTTIQPVLTTTLDDYTRQVVPWESFASWPVQAQAAQAVAARSYGAWYVVHPRTSLYDICDTTSCQVFAGISQETSQTRQGVAATAGRVLRTSAGAVARAEFSASNGGQIAPGDSWTTVRPDPYEMRLPVRVTTWTGTTTAAKLQSAWPQVGTVQHLVVTGRDGAGQWGGRVTSLRVEGSNGSVTITPSQLGPLVTGWKGAWFTLVDGPDALTRDWSGDGRPEVLARDASGYLTTSEFTGTTAAAPRRIGSAWGGFRAVFSGQFTADRMADVLAVDASGNLKLYPSRGGSFGPAVVLAGGFGGYSSFTLAPTLNAGHPMLLARRTSDGALVGFRAPGDGTISTTPVVLSPAGWPGKEVTAMVAVRNITGDASNDLVVRRSNGDLLAFPGTTSGTFSSPVRIGTGWNGFTSLASPGDVNADGRSDIVARTSTGATRLYATQPSTGFRAATSLPTTVATLLP